MIFTPIQTPFETSGAHARVMLVDAARFETLEEKALLEAYGFKPKSEAGVYFPHSKTVYVGCDSFEADELRLAAAKAWELLKASTCKVVYVEDCADIGALVEGFELGSYQFTAYKSKNDPVHLEEVRIATAASDATEQIQKARTIANATNYAKEVVNTIPNDYTPVRMADDAMKLSALEGVTCKVYDEHFLEEQGMEAFLAVNRASVHPPRLIHLTYTPKEPAKKRVIFVGKGLTYDSGGLSLKPGDSMVTMKADKSGGAAALGILKGAAELGLAIEVHAIIGATENMIGGNAYKPDDVLKAKNGTTIEVRNTDAEGRLVLADCLCYAQGFKPDILVDMATLTGACVVAVGEYTTGVMGHNQALIGSLHSAAAMSGELTGSLHFNRYLKKLLKSSVADISNISSSRYGGAITAGLFLDTFIEEEYKQKWIHLDIAGPAYVEKPWGYNQTGASGAGVRMNLYWLDALAKEVN